MLSLFRKNWYLPAIAVLLFASTSFGYNAGSSVSVTFVSGGPYPGYGGVLVDPYSADVGPVGGPAVLTTVQCDDWQDEVYDGETWTATVTNVSGLAGGTPLFKGNSTYSTQQVYDAVAYLASEVLQSARISDTAGEANYSYAMWYLTCQYTQSPQTNCTSDVLSNDSANQATIISLANYALNNATTASGLGWQILTPSSPGVLNGVTEQKAPQEFLIYTPEPASAALAGIGVLGLLGFALVFRRRLVSSTN